MKRGQSSLKTENDNAKVSGCCGGPAPENVDACCVEDAQAKEAGQSGCGCSSETAETKNANANANSCCS